MKTIFKKAISMVLCFVMIFAFAVNSYASAAEDSNIESLKNNATILENTDKISKVLVESENGKCIATLDKETNKITVETIENFDGKEISTTYDAKLDSFEESKISGKLINENNGESYPIGESQDNNGRHKRFIWLLALAPEVEAGLAALAATAATFIAAGVTWTVGNAIKNYLKKEDNADYFAAAISIGNVAVGPPLSKEEAIGAVKSGADVLARTKTLAYSLAQSCGGAVRPAEAHGSKPNYLPHYHPKCNSDVHIFFWFET